MPAYIPHTQYVPKMKATNQNNIDTMERCMCSLLWAIAQWPGLHWSCLWEHCTHMRLACGQMCAKELQWQMTHMHEMNGQKLGTEHKRGGS